MANTEQEPGRHLISDSPTVQHWTCCSTYCARPLMFHKCISHPAELYSSPTWQCCPRSNCAASQAHISQWNYEFLTMLCCAKTFNAHLHQDNEDGSSTALHDVTYRYLYISNRAIFTLPLILLFNVHFALLNIDITQLTQTDAKWAMRLNSWEKKRKDIQICSKRRILVYILQPTQSPKTQINRLRNMSKIVTSVKPFWIDI